MKKQIFTTTTMEKQDQYAVKIMSQIYAMFDEECEYHIDIKELMEGDNATRFTHALATIAPAMVIGKLTGEKYDGLGFNHMANRLCAQFVHFEKP